MSEAHRRNRSGSLLLVGTGIQISGQLTTEAICAIRGADRVFAVVTDSFALDQLRELNPATVSLQSRYAVGKQRDRSYEEMVEAILAPVREGESVCAAFYGHPGVYVWPGHEAVRRARAEGFLATMLPGISAEDCLYADLGLDPARSGCQSFEAMDFLLYARRFDPTASLLLWQVAALGDFRRSSFETDPRWVQALVDVLAEAYPADHPVTIYEAAALPIQQPRMETVSPIQQPRMETVSLRALPTCRFSAVSTLYLPPASPPELSTDRLARLGISAEDIELGNYQHTRTRPSP